MDHEFVVSQLKAVPTDDGICWDEVLKILEDNYDPVEASLRQELDEAKQVIDRLPRYEDTGEVFVPNRDEAWTFDSPYVWSTWQEMWVYYDGQTGKDVPDGHWQDFPYQGDYITTGCGNRFFSTENAAREAMRKGVEDGK